MPSEYFQDFITAVKANQPMLVAKYIGKGVDVDEKITSKDADNGKTAFDLAASNKEILNLLRLGRWLKSAAKLLVPARPTTTAASIPSADSKTAAALPPAQPAASAATGSLPVAAPVDQKFDFDRNVLKPFAIEIFRAATNVRNNNYAKLLWSLNILAADAVNAKMATVPYLAVLSASATLVGMVCNEKPKPETLLTIPHLAQYRILALAIEIFATVNPGAICQVVKDLLDIGAVVDEDVIHLLDEHYDKLRLDYYRIVNLILTQDNIVIHPDVYHKILYRVAFGPIQQLLTPENLAKLIAHANVNRIGIGGDTYFYWAARRDNLGLFIALCAAPSKPEEATLRSKYHGDGAVSGRLLGILGDSQTLHAVAMIDALLKHHDENTALGKELLAIKAKRVAADAKRDAKALSALPVKYVGPDEKADPVARKIKLNLATTADRPELLRDWLIEAIQHGTNADVIGFVTKIMLSYAYSALLIPDAKGKLPSHYLKETGNDKIKDDKAMLSEMLLKVASYTQLRPAESAKSDMMDLWWYVKEFFAGKVTSAESKFFNSLFSKLKTGSWREAIQLMQEQADCLRIPWVGGPYHLSDICRGILTNIGAGYGKMVPSKQENGQFSNLRNLYNDFVMYVQAYPEDFEGVNMPANLTASAWVGPVRSIPKPATPPPTASDGGAKSDGVGVTAAAGTAGARSSAAVMLPALTPPADAKTAGGQGAGPAGSDNPVGSDIVYSSLLGVAPPTKDRDVPGEMVELKPILSAAPPVAATKSVVASPTVS